MCSDVRFLSKYVRKSPELWQTCLFFLLFFLNTHCRTKQDVFGSYTFLWYFNLYWTVDSREADRKHGGAREGYVVQQRSLA